MAGRDEQHPAALPAAVPQLLEEYRVRRQAWMAQADELSRLRDEVRTSAEREAMEIVTTARRDIRQIVMEARGELLVLSAQVQAALSGAAASAALLQRAGAEMEHLAGDGREVVTPAREVIAPQPVQPFPSEPPIVRQTEATAVPRVSKNMSKALLSPPFQMLGTGVLGKTGSSDVWSVGSLRAYAAVFVVAVVTVALGALWLVNRPAVSPSSAAPPETAAAAPATGDTPTSTSSSPPRAVEEQVSGVRISIETIRPAWVRAIVDDRRDAGQTLEAGRVYEFNGSRSIALRIGDAGAVRVAVNGGEPRVLGRDGQVLNRLYAVEAAERAISDPAPTVAPAVQKSDVLAAASPPVPAVAPELTAALPPAVVLPPAPSATASAPVGTNGVGANGVGASGAVPGTQTLLTAAAQQWLDAYHRQDRAALSALSAENVVVNDERPTQERMPAAAGAIARTLDRVNVQAAADTAVLTAVMTERVVGGGLQRSSPVSLVWVQADGAWRLRQVRLVSESRLSQIFR